LDIALQCTVMLKIQSNQLHNGCASSDAKDYTDDGHIKERSEGLELDMS
jgi:hypothetical protein